MCGRLFSAEGCLLEPVVTGVLLFLGPCFQESDSYFQLWASLQVGLQSWAGNAPGQLWAGVPALALALALLVVRGAVKWMPAARCPRTRELVVEGDRLDDVRRESNPLAAAAERLAAVLARRGLGVRRLRAELLQLIEGQLHRGGELHRQQQQLLLAA